MVDHMNRPLSNAALRNEYAPAIHSYSANSQSLTLADRRSSPAAWLLKRFE
jgi:hypothetical protein